MLICVAFISPACSVNDAAVSPEVATLEQEDLYRLEPGDQLRITVFGQEELSGDFRIDDAGRITLPFFGSLLVDDRSLAEVEQIIVSALKSDHLKDPVLSIEVIRHRACHVIGQTAYRAELSLGVVPDRDWDRHWGGDWGMLAPAPDGDEDMLSNPSPDFDPDVRRSAPTCRCEPNIRVLDLVRKCGMNPNGDVRVYRDGKVELAGPETLVMPGDVIGVHEERFF